MKKRSNTELMGAWLKFRLKVILLFLMTIGIYYLTGLLMHMNLSAVNYSTYMTGFITLCTALLDFRSYKKKYAALLDTYENREISLKQLPASRDLIEEGYQAVITSLYNEMQQIKGEMKRQAAEANDYYTLWAHQIKTPIAAMHLLLQNKRQETPCYALEQELFKIEQYAEMALQYLRLESIASDLVLKEYELHSIVGQALKRYAISFIGKKLSLDFEDFKVKVVTDERWLQFVIEQILSNSIKYTLSGKITIKMKDSQTLVISDTGMGIKSEDLPRIFERGFTGYNGRMDKKSTGIGLYLCQKVMKHLAHEIEVQSKVGEGTSFMIHFKPDQIEPSYKNERLKKEM